MIYKYDVSVAKNYLNDEELSKLNDLTNMFLVFAEDEAKERHIMTMQNWIDAVDDLLKFRRKKVLKNSGSVSHKQAIEKAEKEYDKYRIKQDQEYISSMDKMYKRYLEENNIIFYEDDENKLKIEVNLIDDDVWLNVNAIANLFNVQRPAITKSLIVLQLIHVFIGITSIFFPPLANVWKYSLMRTRLVPWCFSSGISFITFSRSLLSVNFQIWPEL